MRSNARKFGSTAVLALLLVVGPLQAQALFACEMMGATLQECCCNDLEGAPDRSLGHVQSDPCCEQIVEVRADPDAAEVIQPIEVRSDVDPPPGIAAHDFDISPTVVVQRLVKPRDVGDHLRSGRLTYLTTQRLRL